MWDEEESRPRQKADHTDLAFDLGRLSIAELQTRIVALGDEIDRCQQEIKKREGVHAGAEALFRAKD